MQQRTLDRTKYLELDELQRLRRVCAGRESDDREHGRIHGSLVRIVVELAVSTGLRVSELVDLAWADVRWSNNELNVRRSKRRASKREDTLALSSDTTKLLRAWRATARRHGRPCEDHDKILQGQRGPLTKSGCQRAWDTAAKDADLPHTIHAARHTLGTHLFRETRDLRLVQQQLGHVRLETTTIYTSASMADRRDGIDAVLEATS